MKIPALLLALLHATAAVAATEVGPIYPCGTIVLGPDGYYWGTSMYGGNHGKGTIYKFKEDGTEWATVLSFEGDTEGPLGGLVNDGAGFLWGTMWWGPYSEDMKGTVFKINATTGLLTTVVKFSGDAVPTKGTKPTTRLLSDGTGSFWGTTLEGGTHGGGTVFKVNAKTGILTTVVEFSHNVDVHDADTASPERPNTNLARDDYGFIWGTTSLGGRGNHGTIFKINHATGDFSKVLEFSFNGATNKGSGPSGDLVNDRKGSLWGTTSKGGIDTSGTIYKINTKTGVLTTVVMFDFEQKGHKGLGPQSLVIDGEGYFYGSTRGGGAGKVGTIFKINAATGALTTLVEFNDEDDNGRYIWGGLLNDGHGSMLGTTAGKGLGDYATVFKINIKTGKFTTLVDFSKAKK